MWDVHRARGGRRNRRGGDGGDAPTGDQTEPLDVGCVSITWDAPTGNQTELLHVGFVSVTWDAPTEDQTELAKALRHFLFLLGAKVDKDVLGGVVDDCVAGRRTGGTSVRRGGARVVTRLVERLLK